IGRAFSNDEELGQVRVVLLSDALWRRRFGGDTSAIGSTLQINGIPFRVIGVMPQEFQMPARDIQFWAPLTTHPWWGAPQDAATTMRWNAIARLKPGLSLAAAESEVNTIARQLTQAFGDAISKFTIRLDPVRPPVEGSMRLALTILWCAVSFVLLIACANITNLFLARGAAREREIAVRIVLGAGRGRLIGQTLMEAAVLAVVSSV